MVTSVVDCWFIFAIFVCGLCVGSFLNVLIYRLPRGLGFVKSRSFCPKCRKRISWQDNIPLLSFVLLKGKCRYCHKEISWQYPSVELATALLTLLIFNLKFSILNQYQIIQFLNFKTILDLILSLLLVWGLLVIFVIDLLHQIIPDEVIIFLVIVFSIRLFYPLNTEFLILNTKNYLVSAIASALFLCSIFLISKGKGMGFGDVKLAFLMGLVLGYPKVIVAFYFAFLTGALVGVTLIVLRKAKFGQKIAFGPFLAAGTFVAYLWGEKIISWAQKLLF